MTLVYVRAPTGRAAMASSSSAVLLWSSRPTLTTTSREYVSTPTFMAPLSMAVAALPAIRRAKGMLRVANRSVTSTSPAGVLVACTEDRDVSRTNTTSMGQAAHLVVVVVVVVIAAVATVVVVVVVGATLPGTHEKSLMPTLRGGCGLCGSPRQIAHGSPAPAPTAAFSHVNPVQ